MSDEVDAAAAELYALSPEEFIEARDARVRELRAAGRRDDGSAVAGLRRPTVAAWLVNLLVDDQPQLPDQLAELAAELQEATARLSGEDLRALGQQRQTLVSGLVDRARSLSRDRGRRVPEGTLVEVEQSLRAALADPEVARQVLSGRLVQAAAYAGFGPGTTTPPRATARPTATTGPKASRGADRRSAAQVAAERAAAEREAAKEALRAAEQAHAAATRTAAAAAKEAARAEQARQKAADRVDDVRSELDRAQRRLDEAAGAAGQAAKRAAAAKRQQARTEADLDRLRRPGAKGR